MTDNGPDIVTFGCRLNAYESEIMRGLGRKAGLSDTVIVNSCAVTAEAERLTRQAIRRARRDKPGGRIVVTGCAAQIDPARFAAMGEVDLVIGNEEKLDPESYRLLAGGDGNKQTGPARILVNDIMSVKHTAPHLIEGFSGRARAFVQVQQGCDHRCTFCIIPFGRGPSRSVPLGALVTQVAVLTEGGYREIVLTGVDITDYGSDLPGRPTLGQAIRRLLVQVPALERLRLSSLDPAEADPDLLRLIEDEKRLLPYFHLSLQAGDDIILKRMKRRHSRNDAIDFCAQVRKLRPDVVFGADLIAGFPTETDAMFDATADLINDCGLTHLHVFPYSERPNTPAASMPQVPVKLRRERAARLRALGEARLEAYLDTRIGSTAHILIEDGRSGRCEHFAQVALDSQADPGEVVRALITGRSGLGLEARRAE